MPNPHSILFRFRQYPFAVSADIEGMFLQVGVIPQDRLRVLWRELPAAEVAVFEYNRHIFGSKDSPTCANYALKRTATDNQANFPDAARQLLYGRLPQIKSNSYRSLKQSG